MPCSEWDLPHYMPVFLNDNQSFFTMVRQVCFEFVQNKRHPQSTEITQIKEPGS
jgi:hypothetical protein